MKLPGGQDALVAEAKLLEYLLAQTHPSGGSKATFFRGLGYNESNYTALQDEFLEIASSGDVVAVSTAEHGTKYVVDGLCRAPNGRSYRVRTIWIIEPNFAYPRFVTAYPTR